MIKHRVTTGYILNLFTNFSNLSQDEEFELGLFLSTSPFLVMPNSSWMFSCFCLGFSSASPFYLWSVWFWIQVVIDLYCPVKSYILFEALGPKLKWSEGSKSPLGKWLFSPEPPMHTIYWLICSKVQAVQGSPWACFYLPSHWSLHVFQGQPVLPSMTFKGAWSQLLSIFRNRITWLFIKYK